jgi:type IV pilus assembly protein PilW
MRNIINHKQRGITLVELMVALAVSGILLAGVGIIYGNSKRTYTVDEEFAHLQENARIAMKYLVEDIRMAGNLGCAKNDGTTGATGTFQCNLAATGNYVCVSLATGLTGYEASGTGIGNGSTAAYPLTWLTADNNLLAISTGTTNTLWSNAPGAPPASFPLRALGSDILIVNHADDNVFKLNTDKAAAGDFDVIDTASTLAAGDILIASDCTKARVFQATAVTPNSGVDTIEHATGTGTPGNSAVTGDSFSKNETEVMKYLTHAYYVANATKGPALFRHDGLTGTGHSPVILVDGVENMQIVYGIDTDATADGVANRYDTANNINFTTANIVSVRISLLMRSERNIPGYTNKQGTYLLAGATTATGTSIQNASDASTAGDQRIRKTFTTTIKIRNKGL